jgi:hypothetical protein
MAAHGVPAPLLAELVRDGLAAELAGRVVAGGHTIEVTRVRITEAGRRALALAATMARFRPAVQGRPGCGLALSGQPSVLGAQADEMIHTVSVTRG